MQDGSDLKGQVNSMTMQELMSCLHKYTPWEMLHLKNVDYIQSIDGLNQSLEHPVSDEDKAYGLHLPTSPSLPYDTLTLDNFFSNGSEICIIQHDRYTPPRTHNHEFYELMYVYEGEFAQKIEGTQFLMHTGDLCIIPPFVYHSLDVHNYSIILNILVTRPCFEEMIMANLKGDNVLSGDFMSNVYAENMNNYVIFHTSGDTAVQGLVLNMCLENINRGEYYSFFMHNYLLLILGHLLRNYSDTCDMPLTRKKRCSQNFEILRYIDLNFRDLTLSGLSEHFNYSPQHMSKLVKAITGSPLSSYILEKRMEAAARLLTTSNMKIKDIGESLGYQNQENFVRTFKKFYNATPTDYRNKNKKMQQDTAAE